MFQHSKVSETEFVDVVDKIANKLASGYKFGMYDVDDIKQEVYIIVLKPDKKGKSALDRWDGVRSLYKFLLNHIQNRLNNLKRDEWFRATCPCPKCDNREQGNTKHKNKQHCDKYKLWKQRNSMKANIAGLAQLSEDYDVEDDRNSIEIFLSKELMEFIDERLDIQLRPFYLKMRSGVYVKDKDKHRVVTEVKRILVEFNKD